MKRKVAIILILLAVANMILYAAKKINDLTFWLMILLLFIIAKYFYNDKRRKR